MTNRLGYVAVFDGFDQLWYVEDGHGATIHGPFGSDVAADDWIAEFIEQVDQLRDDVSAQDAARRERLNVLMQERYKQGIVSIPDDF